MWASDLTNPSSAHAIDIVTFETDPNLNVVTVGGVIQTAHVMINLSHTHAGPSICREDSDKPGGHLIAPYLERLREAVVEATRSHAKFYAGAYSV